MIDLFFRLAALAVALSCAVCASQALSQRRWWYVPLFAVGAAVELWVAFA